MEEGWWRDVGALEGGFTNKWWVDMCREEAPCSSCFSDSRGTQEETDAGLGFRGEKDMEIPLLPARLGH